MKLIPIAAGLFVVIAVFLPLYLNRTSIREQTRNNEEMRKLMNSLKVELIERNDIELSKVKTEKVDEMKGHVDSLKLQLEKIEAAIKLEKIEHSEPYNKNYKFGVECKMPDSPSSTFKFFTADPAKDFIVSQQIHNSKFPYVNMDQYKLIKSCISKHGEKCVVVDAGANLGSFAIVAGMLGAQVFAFEPVNELYNIVQYNIFHNGLEKRVKAFNLAISDRAAKFTIARNEGNYGNNEIGAEAKSSSDDKETCFSTTLDDVLRGQHVHLLKVDIEGHEYEMLKGAKSLFEDYGVDAISFEMNVRPMRGQACKLLDGLNDLGFKIYTGYVNNQFTGLLSIEQQKEACNNTKGMYDLFAHSTKCKWNKVDLCME